MATNARFVESPAHVGSRQTPAASPPSRSDPAKHSTHRRSNAGLFKLIQQSSKSSSGPPKARRRTSPKYVTAFKSCLGPLFAQPDPSSRLQRITSDTSKSHYRQQDRNRGGERVCEAFKTTLLTKLCRALRNCAHVVDIKLGPPRRLPWTSRKCITVIEMAIGALIEATGPLFKTMRPSTTSPNVHELTQRGRGDVITSVVVGRCRPSPAVAGRRLSSVLGRRRRRRCRRHSRQRCCTAHCEGKRTRSATTATSTVLPLLLQLLPQL